MISARSTEQFINTSNPLVIAFTAHQSEGGLLPGIHRGLVIWIDSKHVAGHGSGNLPEPDELPDGRCIESGK